tara:strand:- start:2766 stop:2894 length:129 start_codon:yes stop_codon:yes gene_type:complete
MIGEAKKACRISFFGCFPKGVKKFHYPPSMFKDPETRVLIDI